MVHTRGEPGLVVAAHQGELELVVAVQVLVHQVKHVNQVDIDELDQLLVALKHPIAEWLGIGDGPGLGVYELQGILVANNAVEGFVEVDGFLVLTFNFF